MRSSSSRSRRTATARSTTLSKRGRPRHCRFSVSRGTIQVVSVPSAWRTRSPVINFRNLLRCDRPSCIAFFMASSANALRPPSTPLILFRSCELDSQFLGRLDCLPPRTAIPLVELRADDLDQRKDAVLVLRPQRQHSIGDRLGHTVGVTESVTLTRRGLPFCQRCLPGRPRDRLDQVASGEVAQQIVPRRPSGRAGPPAGSPAAGRSTRSVARRSASRRPSRQPGAGASARPGRDRRSPRSVRASVKTSSAWSSTRTNACGNRPAIRARIPASRFVSPRSALRSVT